MGHDPAASPDRVLEHLPVLPRSWAGQSHMKNPVGGSPQRNPCSEQRNAPTRVPLRSGTLVRVDSATPPRGGASLQQPQTPYAIALASSSSGSWSFHVPLLIPP